MANALRTICIGNIVIQDYNIGVSYNKENVLVFDRPFKTPPTVQVTLIGEDINDNPSNSVPVLSNVWIMENKVSIWISGTGYVVRALVMVMGELAD